MSLALYITFCGLSTKYFPFKIRIKCMLCHDVCELPQMKQLKDTTAALMHSVSMEPRCLINSNLNTTYSSMSTSVNQNLTRGDCLADHTEKNILCFSALFSNYLQLIPSFFDFLSVSNFFFFVARESNICALKCKS